MVTSRAQGGLDELLMVHPFASSLALVIRILLLRRPNYIDIYL